ncbi:MAG: DUF3106 domain-containing protein [Caldimonas sp.]
MTPVPQRRAASLVLAALASVGCAAALAQASAQAPVPPPPFVKSTARPEAGVRWQSLTPMQRQALAPLEREWPSIDAPRKQKWLVIADRYPTLPAPERTRITERMTEWARLTPVERGEVRLRYQEAQQVPAPARSARWEEYQKLPPDAKQQLAARAAASAPGARHEAVAPSRGASAPRDAVQRKANVVPNPTLAQRPRQVAPTVVQAAPGATTRLITRPVTPPAHQQSGMPKIAATPEFVNRSTLLPRRGPQAAAVAPVPPAQPVLAAPPRAPVQPVPARPVEPTPPR